MTVMERVQRLVVKLTTAICDDCIKNSLHLSVRQHANHKTRELAMLPKFDRRIDVCGTCGSTKQVIRCLADETSSG